MLVHDPAMSDVLTAQCLVAGLGSGVVSELLLHLAQFILFLINLNGGDDFD